MTAEDRTQRAPTELLPLGDDGRDGAGWAVAPMMMFRSAGLPAERALAFSGADGTAFLPIEDCERVARRTVLDPWFREAMSWQSPALSDSLLGSEGESRRSPSRMRVRHMSLARHLQRYAVKNETVGFFGPFAWARFDRSRPGVVVACGSGAEVRRRAHFEPWAIDVLARLWAAEPELNAVLAPRLPAGARLDGGWLRMADGVRYRLGPVESCVLEVCDGVSSTDQVVELSAGSSGASPAQTAAVVAELAAAGRLRSGFPLPFDERMDEHLARQLTALSAVPAAREHLAELFELRRLRTDAELCVGDPAKLGEILTQLDRRFADVAGVSATRLKPEHRDSRSVLWLDSLADWDVVLGERAFDSLRRPVSLLLDVCRWAVSAIGAQFERQVLATIADGPEEGVPFDEVFDDLRLELTSGRSAVVAETMARLQRRIADLVDTSGPGPVRIDTAKIGPAWRRAFAADAPVWASGRVHSVDVMLSVADRGAFEWVLGEIHTAVNPLAYRSCALNTRPFVDLERLVDQISGDVRWLPAFPPTWERLTPRTHPIVGVHLPAKDRYWSVWPDDVLPPDTPRICAADLTVQARDGRPWVCGDGVDAPLIDLLGELLSLAAVNVFAPFAPAPHRPRVYFDDVLVGRESWQLDVDALLDPGPNSPVDERLLADRLRAVGVPRFCFARVVAGHKPFFLDLASAPLVKNLLRLLRNQRAAGARVSVQEMAPAFDRLWLRRGPDERLTSEFRILAVDLAAFDPAGTESEGVRGS